MAQGLAILDSLPAFTYGNCAGAPDDTLRSVAAINPQNFPRSNKGADHDLAD